MLNLVTGVFVEGAQRYVIEDRDADLVKHAKQIFHMLDDTEDNEISWSEFCRHLEEPAMSDYLEVLGLNRTDAKDLFLLFDADRSGVLTLKEFVNSAMQLRGNAKSLDLARMNHSSRVHGQRLKKIEKALLRQNRSSTARSTIVDESACGFSRNLTQVICKSSPDSPNAVQAMEEVAIASPEPSAVSVGYF